VTQQAVGIGQSIIQFYIFLMIIYVLMSWFPMRGLLADVQSVLGTIVEPYLSIFRRFIPPIGNVDVSPIVAYFVLILISNFALPLLVR
jgi:YggT family protein